jgi:hypothetical protein
VSRFRIPAKPVEKFTVLAAKEARTLSRKEAQRQRRSKQVLLSAFVLLCG